MQTIIRYILLTALRDWLFIGLFGVILMAYGISLFMGSTALVEQDQMTLAYFAGSSRIILMVGLIVFVCFHVKRAFEQREVEAILSKPISRVQFVIAYWLGFAILSLLAVLPVLGVILLLGSPDKIGLLYWGSSLFLEASLLVAFALLTSLIMQGSVSPVLSCFAFYMVSRLMGFFVATMNEPASLMVSGQVSRIMEWVLKIISTIVPRLDLYAKSTWLIYGVKNQPDLWVFQAQSVVYITLLVSVAVFDFRRKQF